MSGVVTASTREAAEAGAEILRAGGNAVDAAVATALATAVADPANMGIGGYGGFMLVFDPARSPGATCIQFPLCAPQGVPSTALAREYPEEGPECSTVPGVVAGLARALRDFGSLPWEQVGAGAIRLARDGVRANALTRRAFEQNRHRGVMAECFEIDTDASGGLAFRQPALARTLERLAAEGPEWFYAGPLGEAACAAWQAAGVPVGPEEWRGHPQAVEVLEAPGFEARGVRLFAPTLGLSGSACMFATFAAAARLGDSVCRDEGAAELAVAMARIWQHRFAARNGNDFTGVDLSEWVEAALAGDAAAGEVPRESAHTAHLNVVDGEGRIAALSATQGHAWFGGRWAIPGTGVILNGGMHGFTHGGFVRRGARRMGVSNMSPTIAAGADGARVAVGCPGARRIPSNVALVLARHFLGGEPLQRAVSAGRLHAEEPGRVFYEAGRTSERLLAWLRDRFTRVEPQPTDDYYGPLSALRADGAALEAAVDDREATASHAFA